MTNLLKKVEQTLILKKINYKLKVGFLVEVILWIIELKKKRLQSFIGIIIAIKNNGINSSFTVRKIVNNEGIEKVFLIYSPLINNIIIKKKFKVRKAKLYFLRKKNNIKLIELKK